MKKTTLDYAKYYISKGFSVIPIKRKDKQPSIATWKEYQDRLPTDQELVEWFGDNSKHNIAIVTGKLSNIVAADLDSERAVEFAKENSFPISPLSKTGKGYHIVYRYKDGVRNFQKRDNLPDIDLRGDGGYIVVEPSIHPSGCQYQWVEGKGLDDLPFAELPEIILSKSPEHKTPLKELYKGVPEGSRNDSLARLVGSWGNDKLTFEECLENASLWNSKNTPPLPEKEIERTVESIFYKHQRQTSSDIRQKEITPEALLSSLLKWNDILTLNVKTEYLLDKLIPKGSITLFFGKGGIGKTSLALQISRAISEGLPFGDLQTIKTPIFFIDFENPLAVLKQRIEYIGHADDIYVWHISNDPMPPRLDSKQWELYKQLPPGLFIFDTLRASHLSDENNSQDMAIVIARLKELREAGFTILLLHHTPKGNEGIYKGSTALLDLVDHVVSLEAVRDPEGESIEFDKDNLYRLGVRIKTRYEPHHIFLKFNPDIKGFEIAKDPDIENVEAIYEILKETQAGLKQKDLKEKIKNELDFTESQIRKLLKKGEGIAWDVHKGGDRNRALIYIPKANGIIGQHIYSHPINQLNPEKDNTLSNYTSRHTTQSLDNSDLANETDSKKPINQLEVINLEHEEIEIIE